MKSEEWVILLVLLLWLPSGLVSLEERRAAWDSFARRARRAFRSAIWVGLRMPEGFEELEVAVGPNLDAMSMARVRGCEASFSWVPLWLIEVIVGSMTV